MKQTDRSIQFLTYCKQLSQANKLQQLIIPERVIDANSMLLYEEIMASHYSTAMQDKTISIANIKKSQKYPLPLGFAIFTKILRAEKLAFATQFLFNLLKQQTIMLNNKHILIYNIVKLYSLQGQIKKATFYCETLLKQSGKGEDYYTYQFLMLLAKQNRYQQALTISNRHLQTANSKNKIQSFYIMLLQKMFEKEQVSIMKHVDKVFNNKMICLRNYYNLALLLKHRSTQKSLTMFKKIEQVAFKIKNNKLLLFAKINILEIYEKYYLQLYPHFINKIKFKQFLEECEQIYQFIFEHIQIQDSLVKRKKEIDEKLKIIKVQIRNQTNTNFFENINFHNSLSSYQQKGFKDDDILSHAQGIKAINKFEQSSQAFQQKRVENEKKLRYLLKKEKQLKKFFDKLKIQKKGSKLNIKLLNNTINTSNSTTQMNETEFGFIHSNFQQRKRKYKMIYKDGEVNEIISDFIQQWMRPVISLPTKSKVKIKNIQNINKFIINIQQQNDQKQNKINLLTTRTINNSSKKTTQNFRVKSNLSSRSSDRKVLGALKNNDHISNQMINNLKANLEQKKREDLNVKKVKNFKSMLHEGQVLQQQKKYEECHDHYAKMYKTFKTDSQKQTLLIKIAQNFQSLSFYAEAQKTYLKCTKFNNSQAFFKLGNLQIKTGKILQGIQNLEKANCINRNNLNIQIKLVYAYSLTPETTDRALGLANSILKRNPECIQALVMASKILQKKGKLKQALDIAIAIGHSCESAPTFHYTGLLYLNDSNVSDAFKYFHKAIECQPDHLPSLIELATILSESKPEDAIQILKNVLSVDPTNQLAFARLGKIYETFKNDYENALFVYKKGLQYCPSYENYIKIGDCQLKLGLVMQAYLNYKEALSIKKTFQIYEKIGEVHQLQHQQKKAIQSYILALGQLPQDNSNYSKKKKYLFKLGKLSLQIQQFQMAYGYLCEVADMQQNFQVLKLLGQASFGKGDYKQALCYYQQALTMENQDNLELLENVAICFDKMEDYLTSKEIYEKILQVDPKNIRCLNNLANIFLILGKTNQAFYWFEFMLQQVPSSIDKRLRVADIYATIGDWSKVEQHLMICYKQKQSDIRVLERMVNLYKEKRDTKQMAKFQKRLLLVKNNNGKSTN